MAHMALHFYMSVIFVYGMGVFLGPITTQMGWTRAQFSIAAGLQRVEGSVASPIIGFIVDKFGSKKVVLVGTFLIAIGVMSLSSVNSLWIFYASYLLVGLGSSATIGIPFSTPVAKWFRRKRGTAMGWMFVGATFSGIFLPLLALAIENIGWRATLLFCSGGIIILGIPATFIVRDNPEAYGFTPDGYTPILQTNSEDQLEKQPVSSIYGSTVTEAIRTPAFWILATIFGLLAMSTSAMFIHQIPYFESIGFSRAAATTTIATFTLLSGIGRLGFGWIMDYIDPKLALAGLSVLTVIGLLSLLFITEYWHTLIYALVLGIAFGGSIPARPILTSEYFGTRAFGSITGLMQSLGVLGAFIAPVLMGYVFDSTGSYKAAIFILSGLIAIATPLSLILPRPENIVGDTTQS
jgi:sugar phosphate permease